MLRNKKASGLLGLNDHNASKLKSCSKDCTFTKGYLKKKQHGFHIIFGKIKKFSQKIYLVLWFFVYFKILGFFFLIYTCTCISIFKSTRYIFFLLNWHFPKFKFWGLFSLHLKGFLFGGI